MHTVLCGSSNRVPLLSGRLNLHMTELSQPHTSDLSKWDPRATPE